MGMYAYVIRIAYGFGLGILSGWMTHRVEVGEPISHGVGMLVITLMMFYASERLMRDDDFG